MRFHVLCAQCGKRLTPEPVGYLEATQRVRFGHCAGLPWVLVAATRSDAVPEHGKGVVQTLKQWLFGKPKETNTRCELRRATMLAIVERN